MGKVLTIVYHRPLRWSPALRLAAMVLVLLLAWKAQAWAATIGVVYGDSAGSEESIEATEVGGLAYASVNGLARVLEAAQIWRPETKKLVLKLGRSKVKLTALNPVVMVDERTFNLPRPVVYDQGVLWVPVGLFSRIIDGAFPGHLSWDKAKRVLSIRGLRPNITGMEIVPKMNGTLITIRANRRFEVDNSTTSNWLHLNIFEGVLDSTAISSSKRRGLVDEVKAYQFNSSAQISFHLNRHISGYKVYQKENPNRILVVLRESEGKVELSSLGDNLRPNEELAKFDVIVIDPGHGGKDPGAIGPTGLREKDVVLDISKRLAGLLRSRLGIEVILTREDDSFIPLKARGEMANLNGADLFISIHANASRSWRLGGFETYFLSPAKNDEARAVAMRENSALRFERPEGSAEYISHEDYVLRDILGDMLQSSFLKESEDLAGMIQLELDQKFNLENRGVDQAGFYVLVGAKMPNVLVETAFISNRYEERLLKQRGFRQKVAEALYLAIKRFKTKYESKA